MEETSGLASAPVRQILSTCTVDVEMWPSTVVVSVVGELDMADADQVGKILIDAVDAEKPIVRLELAGLTFADSSAIKAILVGAQAAEERGVTYELVNPHDRVRRLLEVTGHDKVYDSRRRATYQGGPAPLQSGAGVVCAIALAAESRQALLQTDQRGQRVALRRKAIADGPDRPSVG